MGLDIGMWTLGCGPWDVDLTEPRQTGLESQLESNLHEGSKTLSIHALL